MPKKARKGKRSMKSKGGKRKSYNKYNISKDISQHFPPALRTKLTMNTVFPITGTLGQANNNASFAYFKLNSILACGPSLQVGAALSPGAYTATYPSGINYLLSTSANTNTLTSVRAPYNQFLVLGTKIKLEMQTSGQGNTHPLQVVIYPASENYGDVSGPGIGQSIENLREQPLARSLVMPSYTTARIKPLVHSISTKKSFGLTRNVATNDLSYRGLANQDPTQLATWIIGANNCGSGTLDSAFTLDCQVTLIYDVVFFDRNMFGSVTPI